MAAVKRSDESREGSPPSPDATHAPNAVAELPEASIVALLWSLLVIDPLIILSTIFCGLASIVLTLFDKSGDAGVAVARFWSKTLLVFAGVKVEVEGIEKIDPHGHYVICANHLSYMDTPVVLSRIPVRFRFLAKRGLFQIPFMGTHLKQAGHVAVPLEDPRAAVKTLTQAAQTMRDRGVSLLIFPEGGRAPDGVLQPFKEGAAYIGVKSQAPLLPVALIGTREVLPYGGKTFRSGIVRVRIGDPIRTAGLTLKDREMLTAKLRDQIAGLLAR